MKNGITLEVRILFFSSFIYSGYCILRLLFINKFYLLHLIEDMCFKSQQINLVLFLSFLSVLSVLPGWHDVYRFGYEF